MQQTSLFTYRKEIVPTLGNRQKVVLEILSQHENMTNKEIAHWLSCDACSVTGRIKELRAMGFVEENVKRTCKITGRTAIAWKVIKH